MREVGIYDAKTHFPRLIDDVEKGESVVITRHGKPVARIVPIEEPPMSVEEAIAAIHEFRKSHPLNGISIRELIDEGRRF
jgi:prevent-host-death family protein